MKKFIFTMLMLLSTSTFANTAIVAVNSDNCAQLIGQNQPFILVLKKGQKVTTQILQCANAAQLPSASLYGLGALQNTTLSYFDHKLKQYHYQKIPEFMELLSATGNITKVNNQSALHMHVALSNEKFAMIGGHLKEAEVGATVELTVIPFSQSVNKSYDQATGLDLIQTH